MGWRLWEAVDIQLSGGTRLVAECPGSAGGVSCSRRVLPQERHEMFSARQIANMERQIAQQAGESEARSAKHRKEKEIKRAAWNDPHVLAARQALDAAEEKRDRFARLLDSSGVFLEG